MRLYLPEKPVACDRGRRQGCTAARIAVDGHETKTQRLPESRNGDSLTDATGFETYRISLMRYRKQERDVHALDENGMVLCNPRDKEAAHRAQMEGIATEDPAAVTCRRCLTRLHKREKDRRD